MPTDSQLVTFGARSKGFFERPLPYRYLSGKFSATRIVVQYSSAADISNLDDGLCAVDISHMNEAIHDTATNHEISVAAKSVLDKCVFRDGTKAAGHIAIGGYLAHVGQCIFLCSPKT